jgi:hypothetical protein
MRTWNLTGELPYKGDDDMEFYRGTSLQRRRGHGILQGNFPTKEMRTCNFTGELLYKGDEDMEFYRGTSL